MKSRKSVALRKGGKWLVGFNVLQFDSLPSLMFRFRFRLHTSIRFRPPSSFMQSIFTENACFQHAIDYNLSVRFRILVLVSGRVFIEFMFTVSCVFRWKMLSSL